MTTHDVAPIPADPGDPAWAEARRSFIGASDAPAVLGLSPWRTPLDVWAEKVGLLDGSPPTLATRLGHELEDMIARLWVEQHPDADVRNARQTVRHPDLPWLAASTDREVDDDGLLECKLVGGRQTGNWSDGVPLYVQCQAQVQMAVTGRRWVDVCSSDLTGLALSSANPSVASPSAATSVFSAALTSRSRSRSSALARLRSATWPTRSWLRRTGSPPAWPG